MTLPLDINDKENSKFSEVAGKVAVNVANPDGTTVNPKKYYYVEQLLDGTDTYLLKEAPDSEWLFQKVTTNSTMSYATVKNNPTVTTYSDAKTAYTTLTYGTPPEAI